MEMEIFFPSETRPRVVGLKPPDLVVVDPSEQGTSEPVVLKGVVPPGIPVRVLKENVEEMWLLETEPKPRLLRVEVGPDGTVSISEGSMSFEGGVSVRAGRVGIRFHPEHPYKPRTLRVSDEKLGKLRGLLVLGGPQIRFGQKNALHKLLLLYSGKGEDCLAEAKPESHPWTYVSSEILRGRMAMNGIEAVYSVFRYYGKPDYSRFLASIIDRKKNAILLRDLAAGITILAKRLDEEDAREEGTQAPRVPCAAFPIPGETWSEKENGRHVDGVGVVLAERAEDGRTRLLLRKFVTKTHLRLVRLVEERRAETDLPFREGLYGRVLPDRGLIALVVDGSLRLVPLP